MLNAVKCHSEAAVSDPCEFQCADCETSHIGLSRTLPAGWQQIDYEGRNAIRCADCLEMIERNQGMTVTVRAGVEPLPVDSAGWSYVDGELRMLHSGCRVTYWPMPEVGGTVLHIQGGRTDNRDAALAVLDYDDLSLLIDELRRVQDAIAPVSAQAA